MKLFELKFGSHLYGTNTESSDTDLKSIYLPTAKEIVLGKYKKTLSTQRPKREGERNTKDDIDVEIVSLDQYLKLLAEGQTMAFDILYGVTDNLPINWYASWIWREIYSNRDKLISKDLTAFMGYAKTQAAKYGLKGHRVAALREVREWANNSPLKDQDKLIDLNPDDFVSALQNIHVKMVTQPDKKGVLVTYLEVHNKKYQLNIKMGLFKDQINQAFEEYGHRARLAENNEGIDWKALSHAVRVNNEGIELLKTGHITFPRPDRELLLKIKTGQLPYKEVADIITDGQLELEEAAKHSQLRSKPDLEWIDNFVEEVYTEIVKKEHKIFEDWNMERWTGE